MSATTDSITCTMHDGATHVIDYRADATVGSTRCALAELAWHQSDRIELLHAVQGLLDDDSVAVARGPSSRSSSSRQCPCCSLA